MAPRSSPNDLLRHVDSAFIAFYCTTYSIYALLIMTGRVAYARSWSDQWSFFNVTYPPVSSFSLVGVHF